MILAEVFAMATDLTILTLWWTNMYLAKLMLSPFIYALKLKIEFLVLNRLTSMSRRRVELRHITIENAEGEIAAANAEHGVPEMIDYHHARGPGKMVEGSTPVSGAMSTAHPEDLDEVDRRYLGRFGHDHDVV